MVIVLNRPYILVLGLQNVKTCKKSWPVNLTEVVSKVFSNLSVVAHLVVPLGWGSCLPGLAFFLLIRKKSKILQI